MQLLAEYKDVHPDKIKSLPIIFPEYNFPLKSEKYGIPNNSEFFYNNCNIFDSIFDTAAIGQYLGVLILEIIKNNRIL